MCENARTASVLNDLKNDPSYIYEFIGDVILKINIIQADLEKIQAKVYVN